MDHLPRPKSPFHTIKAIPWLGAQYPWHNFADDVTIQFESETAYSMFLQEPVADDFLDSLCMFQSRCFVNLYVAFFRIFDIPVNAFDIIIRNRSDPAASSITTEALPKLLGVMEAKYRDAFDHDSEESDTDVSVQFERGSGILTTVNDFLDSLAVQRIREHERRLWPDKPPGDLLFDGIHLSIILLGQALTTGLGFINTYPMAWGPSPWLHEQMLAAGWCRSERFSLLEQHGGDPAMIYYLSQLDRRSLRRDVEHRRCEDSFRCNRENLDHSTYKTKHVAGCHEARCGMVVVDSADTPVVSNIVLRGNTPLVCYFDQNQPTGKEAVQIVELESHALPTMGDSSKPYVCFSHVWSDGLGNLSSNAIPRCQAKRLQQLANDLFPDIPQSHPIPFWLDTLCVPLKRPARDRAIEAMRLTYSQAAKVLVLDAVLSQASVTKFDTTELAVRIRVSTWARRLWTFHEGCLAKNLFYQFADRAVNLEFLDGEMVKQSSALRADNPGVCPDSQDWYPNSRLSEINSVLESCLRWIRHQETVLEDSEGHTHLGLAILLGSLRFRWTSRLEDETICLAGILGGQGLSEVLHYTTGEDRMRAFLSTIGLIPADILYILRPRSTLPGFRWMPLSFLGGGSKASPLFQPNKANVTAEGLQLLCEGLLLHDTSLFSLSPLHGKIKLDGHTYRIEPASELDLRDFAGQELAILLRTTLIWTDDPSPGQIHGRSKGALVTLLQHQGQVLVASYGGVVEVERHDTQYPHGEESLETASMPATKLPKTQQWLIQ